MGALSGSISFSKFVVRGEVPSRFQEKFMRSVKLRAFKPLELEDEEDERCGWCAVGNGLEVEPDQGSVILNEYLLLGFRVDKWRLPKTLFDAHYEQVAQALQQRVGRDKLSKKEREEVKFRVTRRLRKKILPTMRHSDLVWDLNQGSLLFWNRSERVKEQMTALFEKTFQLTLDEFSPFIAAREQVDSQLLASLCEAEPSSFFDPDLVVQFPKESADDGAG